MTISVMINGALGKMGQHCVQAIESDPELTLVAQGTRVTDLGETIDQTQADVVVDFTHADTAFANCQTILEHSARPIIGSSGLNQHLADQLSLIAREKKIGGIIAPNFAIGAVLMMQLAQKAATYFNDVEIVEKHHQHKEDAPSGTAIRTAEMIAQANPQLATARDNQQGIKEYGVPIHSIRLPGVFTHQEVMFGSSGETLTITHNCSQRQAAMPGVVLACKKVMALNELVYGLEHIL